ncbi:oligosaccharide flippase family protein [Flavobacterium davisii]|uniref:oligosaccharide flippase family protein n=1 Tax=Flavobacterium davisii TaxID=2906077 RepID=UPI0035D08CFB
MNSIYSKLKSTVFSSEINRKIITHGFWIVSGNIVSKFFLLIATILMAKFLNKEEYGQFGIIKSTILMFALFAGMELGITATKYISQYKTLNPKKIEKIIGLSNFFALLISIIITLLVFLFAEEIAKQINAPHLSLEIKISSFVLFFSSLNGIQNGILAGVEKFRDLSVNTTVAGVLSSLAMVVASKYNNLNWVVIAFGSNFFILFILNFFSLKKYFYPFYKVSVFDKSNFEEITILWKFSLPAILAGLMVGPVTWFCNYLLVNQVNGYQQMANFDIANQWRNTILFIPGALCQIALPLLSSTLDNKEEYKSIYIKNIKINFYITLVLVIFLVAISPIIINMYGEKYSDAIVPIILMFVTSGFIAVNNVIGQAIASKNMMWLGFYVNLLWAFVLIVCSYFFVVYFNYGAIGLSIAYLISYIIHTIVQFLFINKKI